MNMTATYVRAAVQRAQHEGHKEVTLMVDDLLEILPLIDSTIAKNTLHGPMKRCGWISPHDLMRMRKEGGKNIRMSRRKNPECCMQVYFADEIADAMAESIRLVARRADNQRLAQISEGKAHVSDPVS